MDTRKLSLMASCSTVLVLLLASCASTVAPAPVAKPTAVASKMETPAAKAPTSPEPGAPTSTPKPAADQPRYGGTLDRAISADPISLDLHQESSLNSHLPLAGCYSGLVRYDTVVLDKVVADLGESWEASPDGTIWTFHLRGGVKWHDDKLFTAEDAKFSLERMAFGRDQRTISPTSGPLLSALDMVETPDENTVRMRLKYPSASFLSNLVSGWVLMMPKHVIQAKGDMKRDVIGTGPFTWKSYSPGTVIEIAKNREYFTTGRPYLDGVRMFVIKDAGTRLAAFRTGRVKMTTLGTTGLTHAEAETVRKEMAGTAVVHTYPANMCWVFFFRLAKAPWSNVQVRRAIDLAFDRQGAIRMNFNVGSLGAAMDPNVVWGIPEEEMKQRPGYRQPKDADIAEAKRLMAEAGYPNGFKTSILTRPGVHERMGVFAQDQLAKIGIEASVEPKDMAVWDGLMLRRAFETSVTGVGNPVMDPDVIMKEFYVTDATRNYGDFSDKQIDEMYEKQARTVDAAERKGIVRQMQERLLELVPSPILYWDLYNMGHWKEVRGYSQAAGVFSHNSLMDVWLAK